MIMNLLWFSNSVITMASSIVIIPSQIKGLVGDSNKGKYMGILVACCAVTTLSNYRDIEVFLYFKNQSDRCRLKIGRRRPFLLVGSIILMQVAIE
ncbi:LOW QUALITY PROTEIN: hypothetical protein MXB_1949 [Myxobolus squamalis]|nr:LOW QUALITY PROTEIN: hypothetical protein MXB_1949 [Myxobolus squamalis]